MASLSSSALKAVLDNTPPSSTQPQGAPWTAPTPDRLLRTTAAPAAVQYGPGDSAPGAWSQSTAAYSAVSPPDPTTGEKYLCLIRPYGNGSRFDYSLNGAGEFSAVPLINIYAPDTTGFGNYVGWAYAIDSTTGQHYFLCAASWELANTPNSLHWAEITTDPGLLGPPLMHQYKSETVQPQGLWATGEIIWFSNSDGSLWQVALSDLLTNSTESLKQLSATGTVQAVISDGATTPTYYVLSAVQNGSSYDLVVFPAGDPGSAVTIQSNWSLGGIKTTPDGAVWKVIPDLNSTSAPTAAQVTCLIPPYPSNGLTPTWVDPFANVDPTFCPTGLSQTIMDAVPLSATNILLRTTDNYAEEQSGLWPYRNGWALTRVGIGVLDQPALPFPTYTGDMATAYTEISQDLIATQSESYDIRAQYPSITAAQASGYYAAISNMSVPSSFSDSAAWTAVQTDLTGELYNLVSALSFWESTTDLINLQNELKSLAAQYVSNALAIPTQVTLIDKNAGSVNALNIASPSLGAGASVISLVSTVLSAAGGPAGSVIAGVLSLGASLASIFCASRASEETNYVIQVSDPMYQISAKLGDIDGVLGQLFAETLTVISSSLQTCAKDRGMLATVGGLSRNQNWLNSTPQFVPGSNEPPQSFNAYYSGCVVSLLAAFVPLITAATVIMTVSSEPWPTYEHEPVYVGPKYPFSDSDGNTYQGELLQYASAHDQSKPLGQDLDTLLFTTWSIAPAAVFLDWGLPAKPSWIS